MNSINEFLARAAEQCGFERNGFVEKRMPTSFENLLIIPFFGDIKSTFVMSSFIVNQLKRVRSNKYIILCSWPGHKELYPYVDEYWQPKDLSSLPNLHSHAEHMDNTSDLATQYLRSLNIRFENVLMPDDIKKYYNLGFQQEYWDKFKEIYRHWPSVPSVSKIKESLSLELNKHKGSKIVIYPSKQIRLWDRGRSIKAPALREFWISLTKRLIAEGITPVVYQNSLTYDLSTDFTDQCVYLVSKDILEVLSCMRSVGCVLDMYSGISRYAILARCPFVCVDERTRFIGEKEYEIDDICCQQIPKQYIFSFSSFLTSGEESCWNDSIINNVVVRLENFLPKLDRDSWASTSQSDDIISYDCVRQRKVKKLGTKFIRKY